MQEVDELLLDRLDLELNLQLLFYDAQLNEDMTNETIDAGIFQNTSPIHCVVWLVYGDMQHSSRAP